MDRSRLDYLLSAAGAVSWGVTPVLPIDPGEMERYRRWLAEGRHGEMAYLERYDDVRSNPALLLDPTKTDYPEARSVISCAFAYHPCSRPAGDGPAIAAYALGDDYHTVLRRRLQPVVDALLHEHPGHRCRICVDTAPVRERVLARRAGVGFIGRNGMLIVSGVGSYVFLAEIVTSVELEADEPCTLSCAGCGECQRACPGGALSTDDGDDGRAVIDCRRCLSYLTIEYRGDELPADVTLDGRLYGCDECQRVCPHNAHAAEAKVLPEFAPRPKLLTLTRASVASLSPSSYRRLTAGSAMSRARLHMLLRNLRHP